MIGNFFGSLYRSVRVHLCSVVRTGSKIPTDMAKNKSPDVRAEDIIFKRVRDAVNESTQRLVRKLRVVVANV